MICCMPCEVLWPLAKESIFDGTKGFNDYGHLHFSIIFSLKYCGCIFGCKQLLNFF